jgi:hypothetical protein
MCVYLARMITTQANQCHTRKDVRISGRYFTNDVRRQCERLGCFCAQGWKDCETMRYGSSVPAYQVSYDTKNHPSKNFSDGKNKDWKGRYADKQKTEPLGPYL